MSPNFLVDQNRNVSILDICMSKIILATKEHDINIRDLASVLCDVIVICDNEFITDPDEICDQIKNKIYGKFHIELKM